MTLFRFIRKTEIPGVAVCVKAEGAYCVCFVHDTVITVVSRWWCDEHEVNVWNAQWCISGRELSSSCRVFILSLLK